MTEIFPSPVPHSAHVRAIFKETVIDMVVLDDLPDVSIYRKGIHFLEGEKEDAVSNLFPYATNPHKAFPRIPVFQTVEDIKVKLA